MVKNFQFRLFLLMLSCILVVACDNVPINTAPTFEEAWIRALPTGSGMTAGFGTLHNPGQKAIQVLSFSSPSFGDVSLHRTEVVDGVSRMQEVPVLPIGAASSVVLEPGGYHLMLMVPAGKIQPGDRVNIKMVTSDGDDFTFTVPVERR